MSDYQMLVDVNSVNCRTIDDLLVLLPDCGFVICNSGTSSGHQTPGDRLQ